MLKRRGSTLLMTIVLLIAVSALVITALNLSQVTSLTTTTRIKTQTALQVAESGIEKAVWCLNHPTGGCPGGSNFTGETGVSVGQGSYSTTVVLSGSTATITSTSTVGSITKQVVVNTSIAASVTPAFSFGVQTGIGGIIMTNNAHITGNIYTSGSVTGTNGSYLTGDAILTPSPGALDMISNPSVTPPTPQNFGSDGAGNDYLAQSFVPTVTEKVYSVDLKLAKVNAPTSSVTIRIYSDNGSNNPGSDLSAGGQALTISVPNSTSPGWEGTNNGDGTGWSTQPFNPSTNPILVAGTKYWLVISTSSASPTRFWTVIKSADDTTYATGTAKRGGSASGMTALNADLAARLTLGGVNPTLSLPSVQGDAYAYTINSTTVGKKAYYQNLVGTVRANGGAITCHEGDNGPDYCFDNSPNQPTASFPLTDSDISALEGQATLGGIESSNCIINGGTIGPKQYNCDVTLQGTVTINGTIWVNGNLTFGNNAIAQLSAGYGSSSGVIIADYVADRTAKGQISLSNNGNLTGNGTAGTYIMAISMYNQPSINYAIDVSNNLSAGVLYAPLGRIHISNNAALKEVTAYQLVLDNNASVQYETGLASAVFTSGPGGAWTYKKGSYQVTK